MDLEYDEMKGDDLRALAADRELSTSGTNPELIDRLRAYDATHDGAGNVITVGDIDETDTAIPRSERWGTGEDATVESRTYVTPVLDAETEFVGAVSGREVHIVAGDPTFTTDDPDTQAYIQTVLGWAEEEA